LKSANALEHETVYDTQVNFNEDEYSNEAYVLDDNDDFNPEGGE